MRCDRCQEDFSFWKMVTNTYQLLGFGGKLYPTKRTTCKKCEKVYLNLEKQSKYAVQLKKDTKLVIEELERLKLINKDK